MRKPLVQEMTDDLKSIVPKEQQHKFIMRDFSQWLLEVEAKCNRDAHSCTQAISERLLGRADVAMELRLMIDDYIIRELTNE